MSQPAVDLSHFDKSARSKIRLSIAVSKLLHLIYIVEKNCRREPQRLTKYQSFWQLVSDLEFIRKALIRESRSGKLKQDPWIYLRLAGALKERGYTGLLELIDAIWDLTVHHRRIDSKLQFENIIGMGPHASDKIKFYGRVSYRSTPFIMNIDLYRFLIIESESGMREGTLAKTLVYLGSLAGTDKTLGMFARLSVQSIDAEHMVQNQSRGYAHKIVRPFKFYPTALRMQRLAYRKVEPEKVLESETLKMLSELYVSEGALSSIVNMDVHANILAMAPSLSLYGGLCIPTAFRGELLDVLGSGRGARVKVGDVIIKAYPSYFSILTGTRYPGEYVFVMFHPFTIPRIGLVVGTYPVNILDKIKPKKRNVSSLDRLFPKICEVARIRI